MRRFFSRAVAVLILLLLIFFSGSQILAEGTAEIIEVDTDLTAEEIINRRDDNEYIVSARMEAEMIIIQRNRETAKEMVSYGQEGDGLIEFINPRDRGTKYLKLGDELWMYFPDAEDLVRISGHMLRQLYEFELLGQQELEGRPAYVLRGTAREGKEVSYYERIVWIDQERFIGLREELYARNGRLLKVAIVNEVKEFEDNRWYPVEMVMEDKLREESRTIFRITELEFNPEIPEGIFSLESLQ